MKNNVDKSRNRSLIITVLMIALTIAMGIIYGPEKKKIEEKDTSVTANSGNERADIGTIAKGQNKYTENPSAEYITKYNEWIYKYSRTDDGKNVGASKWNSTSIKKAAWCYIFIDWCAKEAGCKLTATTSGTGFYLETAIANAIADGGWYKSKGRLVSATTCANLVSKGEVGDMVFSKSIGPYAGYNHICVITSKTDTSVTLYEGDYQDSDGKYKVWTRTVKSSSSKTFGYQELRSLGKPMYRATATLKTDGGTISSMPSNWSTKISESGSGTSKTYKYKFFDDLEYYDSSKQIYLPDKNKISRNGYTFLGWKDGNGNSFTKIKSKQRGNITLTAQWQADSYKITYVTNGGTINSGKVDKYTPGKGATLPTDVTRYGYDFVGWNSKSDFSGSIVKTIGTTATGDKTYYAQWSPKNFTITYVTNGGTINSGNVTSYTYGKGATLPTNVTRTGYTFAGWFIYSDFSGSQVKTIGTSDTGNKTYYAKWTANVYTVTLVTNGGTINSGNVTSYTYGKGATLPTNVTRTGHTFGGWYAESNFSGSRIGSIGTTATGNKTYYAKWTPNVYTVTLVTNGGTINSGNVTSYTYGKGATLPTNVTKRGHTFGGWYRESDFSGSRIGSIGTTATGNKTYYAKWTPNVYTVTLNTNEGTINSGNVTKYTYGKGATLPTNVTRRGYDFKGWYAQSNFSGSRVYRIGTDEIGNKTFYAKWTPKVYTVKLHPNGGTFAPGTEVTQYTYTVGAKLPNALQITKPGCEFVGWFENSSLTGSPVTKITPTDIENKEYWAKWNTFNLSSDKALYYVYGLNNDDSVYKAEKVTLNIQTQSTSPMYAVLATSTDYAYKVNTPVRIYPGRTLTINVPKAIGSSVAKNKKDRVIYAIIEVNCSQYDGDKYVDYKLYINKKITLRFSATYNLW